MIITENYINRRKMLEEAVSDLELNDDEKKFLAFLLEMRDFNEVSKICSIIKKAKDYQK